MDTEAGPEGAAVTQEVMCLQSKSTQLVYFRTKGRIDIYFSSYAPTYCCCLSFLLVNKVEGNKGKKIKGTNLL